MEIKGGVMVSVLQGIMRPYSSMKALRLLAALAEQAGDCSLADLAAATGLSSSSAYRILQEMQQCGFALKDNDTKRYRAGFNARLLAIELQKTNFLYEAAKEEMDRLNNISLETIHLIGQDGMDAIYLAKRGAKSSVGLRSAVGKHIPMYCTGGGKALLAWKDKSWLEEYMTKVKMESFTSQTIITPQALLRELEVIRIQGYAMDNHEHHSDVVCVAAPIFDIGNAAVASIGISAPDYRFPLEKALSYKDEVLRSAAAITEKLGWKYPIPFSRPSGS